MPTPNLPPGFDFTDPDIHAERLPVEELAELRRTAPIWWNEQPLGVGGFDDGGFWVVSKHKDVKEISRRSDVFSSLQKTALPRYKDGTVGEQIDRGKFVLLNMDAPQHTHLRKIISRGFTPVRWSACATICVSAPGASWKPRPPRDPATSSNRCRANFPCRPSPGCSVCRKRIG